MAQLDNARIARYLEDKITALRIKASREFNPLIKQLIEDEITQIREHITEITKPKTK